jgi:hypothetical protein
MRHMFANREQITNDRKIEGEMDIFIQSGGFLEGFKRAVLGLHGMQATK